MRRIQLFFILIVLSFCSNPAHTQKDIDTIASQKLESLISDIWKIYRNDPNGAILKSDTALVEAKSLNDICNQIKLETVRYACFKQISKIEDAKSALDNGMALVPKCDQKSKIASLYKQNGEYFLLTGQRDSTLYYLNASLNLYQEENDSTGLAGSYSFLGRIWDDINPDTSIYYFTKSYGLAEQMQDSFAMAVAIGNIGYSYMHKKGDYKKAMENFEICGDIFLALDAKGAVATTYFNMANIYLNQEDHVNSLKYELMNLELRKEINDVGGEISSIKRIAQIYQEMDRFDDAMEQFQKAVRISKENNWEASLPHIYNSIGTNFLLSNKDSAEVYFRKTIAISEKLNAKEAMGAAYTNLGTMFKDDLEYKKAEENLLKGYSLFEEIQASTQIGYGGVALTGLYLDWFENSQNTDLVAPDLDQVEEILQKIEEASRMNTQFRLEETLYKNYIQLYTLRNDLTDLSHYQGKLIMLRDSMIEKTNIAAANEWAEKLKTAEKENEINSLEAENKLAALRNDQFKNLLIGLVLFFSLLGIGGFKFLKERNARQRLQTNQKFRSRLSANLHDDVGSLLNSLALHSELAFLKLDNNQKKEFEDIANMSRTAMESLRDTVWAIDSQKDKYDDLLNRMVDYADQHLAYKNIELKVNKVNWNTHSNMSPESRQNIYYIFKETITNILKHSNADQVDLTIGFENKDFIMTVQDNGEVKNVKTSGIGTNSMKKRAQNIGGEIDFKASGGYKTTLAVPV